MRLGNFQYRSRRCRQAGYMLVVLIFLMAGLVVGMLATAPAVATAIKRDKEEEMIHRGAQYARAIKKYYRKFGRYPTGLEALENTNNIRFLRKRYKDPFAQEGKWQLIRFGEVRFDATQRQGGAGFQATGQPGLPNVPGVTGMLQGQPTNSGQVQQPGSTGFGGNQPLTGGQSSVGGSLGNSGTGSQPVGGSFSGASDSSSGSSNRPVGGAFAQSGSGSSNQVFGGGAIIGVASTSERESVRIVADKNHYKDWKFVYDPTFDRGNLITGPYDPKKQLGQFSSGIGKQIGQPIGQSIGQPAGGQQGSSFGGSSFGQPVQNPMQPYQPPDQPSPNNPE
jgi:type II secretory pathway pseudopilin PulG